VISSLKDHDVLIGALGLFKPRRRSRSMSRITELGMPCGIAFERRRRPQRPRGLSQRDRAGSRRIAQRTAMNWDPRQHSPRMRLGSVLQHAAQHRCLAATPCCALPRRAIRVRCRSGLPSKAAPLALDRGGNLCGRRKRLAHSHSCVVGPRI